MIDRMRQVMDLSQASEDWSISFYQNRVQPEGVLEYEGDFNDDDKRRRLQQDFDRPAAGRGANSALSFWRME